MKQLNLLCTSILYFTLQSEFVFARPKPESQRWLNVPSVVQATEYTCGPASILAAIEYYGIDSFNETNLAKEMGTTQENGTEFDHMLKFVATQGFKATLKTRASIDELVKHLAEKQVAIVAMQAWFDNGQPTGPIADHWADGHYVVVVGIDKEYVYFMDPSLVGSRGFLSRSEFLDRWHDVGVVGGKLYNPALFIEGTPKPPDELKKIQ